MMGVFKMEGIWDTVERVIAADETLLSANTVVVIFKERGSTEVVARKIAKHRPPHRPWGVQFCICPECEDAETPYDFYFRNNRWNVKVKCRGCGWESAWVKEKRWGKHCFRSPNGLRNVFWHAYPPSQALQRLFAGAA